MNIKGSTGQPGVQKFSINPTGGLILGDSVAAPPAVPTPGNGGDATPPVATPITPEESFEPPKELTPFEKLYPGVDPSRVEMVLDDKTGKLRFKQVETPPETPDTQDQAPIVTPEPPSEIAQLREQVAHQSQMMQAMLIAQAQGKPLGEVLGLTQPASQEPDYSQYDLYDETQRAEFVRQLRQDAITQARAEVQAQIAPHLPSIQGAKQQQEYAAVAAKHSKDPDFERKAALTNQLVQGNPNVSFKDTYELITIIQQGLKPTGGSAPNNAGQTTLTPEQQAAKAAQAARLPQSSGVRGGGEPQMPDNIRSFKDAVRWTTHQAALGNIKV